ncbi:amidohydrolase [Fusarium subglutinans]|uniref:Amidohydrolase n=1 Tax=Gibberella subglutinans TaxID=42677 RepID=A0A8H5KWA8_GIBSU|nr:amidohydrolase [Fusarium subglutinans]KAF5579661.1 amidohydrolase [Fusarium subglutinans]
MFMDGVLLYPANTGSLIEPYFQPVANTSIWAPKSDFGPKTYWDKELLSLTLTKLFKNNIDAQIHVDGDLAVRTALDALEELRNKNPKLRDYRVGLAHNEVTDPSDWPRFAELKADPIMSFQWSQASSVWLPNGVKSMGPRRSYYMEAFGELAKFGSAIIYGSNWPIDPPDEWLAIKAGATRSGDPKNPHSPASQGAPYNGNGLPGLTLTRDQAIRAITTESARFLRADAYIGSLEVGKLADAIVLKANYFEVPEEHIARQKTLLTMVGGEPKDRQVGSSIMAQLIVRWEGGTEWWLDGPYGSAQFLTEAAVNTFAEAMAGGPDALSGYLLSGEAFSGIVSGDFEAVDLFLELWPQATNELLVTGRLGSFLAESEGVASLLDCLVEAGEWLLKIFVVSAKDSGDAPRRDKMLPKNDALKTLVDDPKLRTTALQALKEQKANPEKRLSLKKNQQISTATANPDYNVTFWNQSGGDLLSLHSSDLWPSTIMFIVTKPGKEFKIGTQTLAWSWLMSGWAQGEMDGYCIWNTPRGSWFGVNIHLPGLRTAKMSGIPPSPRG